MSPLRTDYRLLVAVIAPLLLWQWVPRWDESIFSAGWGGAVMFCVAIAVLEEVIFRGGLQGWLLRRETMQHRAAGLSRANWITSSLFAFAHLWMHPAWLMPGYLGVSLVLGYFRERYQGILIPVLLHAWYNLALLLLPVLLGS
ncbi:MAG: JDVT-CTERM system CAAX-type protease [Gammaproteobacteria bacterium]|nr:JDVT-CTERM system CAAX-type protease [Gammaproteobacteria bacterium]MBU1776077.1 JDVT-CTERM system CAAX-type protease [Gammaproteobacteria bacterium]MBU1970107.1 JDVT-CTERM system CAAX-type protease [Gammaproteobacteria bacterium]